MAVAYVNSGTAVGTTLTTGTDAVTPAAPASMVVGNIIVVTANMDAANATATNANLSTASGGWAAATDLAEYTAASPRAFVKLFWKIIDSTSMAMPVIDFTGMATGSAAGGNGIAGAHQFSGVDATTPFGTSGAIYTAAGATSTTIGPLASPGTVATGNMAFGVAGRSDDNSTTSVTVTAGWTNLNAGTAYNNAVGADCSQWMAYRAGAGADPGTLTWSALSSLNTAMTGRIWVLVAGGGGPPPALYSPPMMAPYVGA